MNGFGSACAKGEKQRAVARSKKTLENGKVSGRGREREREEKSGRERGQEGLN